MSNYYNFYDALKKMPPVKLKGSWMMMRYEDVKYCLDNPKEFSSRRADLLFADESVNFDNPKTKFAEDIMDKWIRHCDMNSTGYFTDTKKAMTQKINEFMSQGSLQQVVLDKYEEIKARVEAEGLEEYDLKFDVALPVVADVVMKMLGIEKHENLAAQQRKMFEHGKVASMMVESITLNQTKVEELADSLLYLIKLGANYDGVDDNPAPEEFELRFSDMEIQQSLMLSTFFFNVTNMIAISLKVILENKDQVTSKNLKSAILEALRIEAPVQAVLRVCHQDTVIRNTTIKEGDVVTLFLGSANRDENVEALKNPGEFNLNRERVQLMTFGFGIHHCVGQHISLAIGNTLVKKVWEDQIVNNKIATKEVVWDDDVRGYRTMKSFTVTTNTETLEQNIKTAA